MLKSGKKYDLKLFKVKLEELCHDVPNYALKWEHKGKKGIYAVDTATLEGIEAKGYDLFLVENNYNEDLIEEHIQEAKENNDENKIYYLERAKQTHLSSQECNSFLIENMGSNSEYCYIHQSSYNYREVD